MATMTPEAESIFRAKAIIILMHMLNLREVTFNQTDLKAASHGEDEIDLCMSVNLVEETLTIKLRQVTD